MKQPIDPLVVFGFLLLLSLTLLAAVIGLGHVTKDSSYGLEYILGSLATLTGGFAQWAFRTPTDSKPAGSQEEKK